MLWGGGARSVSQLSEYASLTAEGYVSLDFGNGNVLDLLDVESVDVLNNDLDLV